MECFAGKTVVVSGAASGIGFALCRLLCDRGALVHALDRDAAGLERLREACGAESLRTAILDVADETTVATLLGQVVESHGHLDYLFNNAGIYMRGETESMTTEAWRRIVDVNLWGVIHGTHQGYALMLKQGHGHIVNTASTAGLTPLAKSVAYAATKHAVVGLSLSLREEARAHGIRVSVVVPGIVDTGIFASATSLRGQDIAATMQRAPVGKISAERAAREILQGVAANRRLIVFPLYNRVLTWLYRLFPDALGRLINRVDV